MAVHAVNGHAATVVNVCGQLPAVFGVGMDMTHHTRLIGGVVYG
jgi:hypothetical protein